MAARSSKIKQKCRDCTERKRNDRGILFCPHLQCIFGECELKLWRDVGGAPLLNPSDLGFNDK